MVCVNEKTLDVFLDGGLDAARSAPIERHLETCPRCRKAAWQRMALDVVVTGASFALTPASTSGHLVPTTLAAYLARKLSSHMRDAVEGHLADCGACRRALLERLAPAPAPRRRRRRCSSRRLHRKRR